MGKFNDKISAEFHPPKKWILERPLSYQNNEMEESALQSVGVKCSSSKITCKKGNSVFPQKWLNNKICLQLDFLV